MATLPMLSSEGWLTDPKTQMTRLFAHMFLTDHSQSNLYEGVTSLQWITNVYGHDVNLFIETATRGIKDYYQRYYDSVEVEVRLEEDGGSEQQYTVHLRAVKDGETYELHQALRTDTNSGVATLLDQVKGEK